MPNEIWWKLANFAVLVGGLGYLISKNAGPYFRARGEEIREGIREAAEVRAEAEARAAAIESKLGNLSGEIESIRTAAKAEIASEAARIQAEAEAHIGKIRNRAEMEIASATKHASADLKAYSAQLALELAEKQIRQQLDPRTQEQLADTFVNDLRQEKAKQAGRCTVAMPRAVSIRYARALVDAVLAPTAGLDPKQALKELRAFTSIVRESNELRNVLFHQRYRTRRSAM